MAKLEIRTIGDPVLIYLVGAVSPEVAYVVCGRLYSPARRWGAGEARGAALVCGGGQPTWSRQECFGSKPSSRRAFAIDRSVS